MADRQKLFKILIIVVLFVDLVFAAKHFGAMGFDLQCFQAWTTHIFQNGLSKAYTITRVNNDYMPFSQYCMWVFGKLAGSEQAIIEDLGYFKGFTLFFDFLAIWYVYKWIDKKVDYPLLLLINILNIGFSYNTLLWGQIDGMYCALSFISLYYAYNNKILLSVVCYVIALNMKLQAIIIGPLLGLTYLYYIVDKKTIKPFLYSIPAIVVVELVFLAPFLGHEDGVPLLWKQITTSIGRYDWIGDYTFWSFVVPNDKLGSTDQAIFALGLTYRQAGLLLFSASLFIALLPMFITIYRRLVGKPNVKAPDKKVLWMMAALSGLCFYCFNTEMHERYCQICLLFVTAYSFYTRDYIPYLLFTLFFFLLMEGALHWLGLRSYSGFLWSSVGVASGFAVLMAYLYIKMFRTWSKDNSKAISAA